MRVRPPVTAEFKGWLAHWAQRRRIRRDLRGRDRYERERAAIDQPLWAYKDARLRGDGPAAEVAWQAYRHARQLQASGGGFDWYVPSGAIWLAVGLDDIDRAARELLEWRPHVDTRNAGADNGRRTAVRNFVSACIRVLEREASVGHPLEKDVDTAMREVAVLAEDELNPNHWEGFWRIGELRSWTHMARASTRLAEALASPDAAEQARWAASRLIRAVTTREPDLAAEAYQHVMGLVPSVAAARPEGEARQRLLAAAQEHTEEAGYWLARTGRYREAVVALETGRAVGLSQALNPRGAAGPSPTADVRYDDILAATGQGALVYLATATAGGYALVVAARHDPQFVELPKLDRATVADLLGALLPGSSEASAPVARTALRQAPAAQRDVAVAVAPPTDQLAAGLERLWEHGFRPLGFAAAGRIVTYVPVGLLSLLPLHAAGAPGHPGMPQVDWRHAGHLAAIRYAPNARSLVRCQETARELATGSQPLLAVDVPDGSGAGAHAYLHYVGVETAEAVRLWAGPASPLPRCTWEQFRAAADVHTVWHLACHGSARPKSILDTRLYFADRPVTLRELREALPAGRRRLAVLSACESNLTDVALPNEVVGLPTALLQIGFAGVIASSWKVDDLATAYLMAAFYRQWREEGQEPAVALNLAQRWLRNATPAELAAVLPDAAPVGGEYPYRNPRYWAAFAYTGA